MHMSMAITPYGHLIYACVYLELPFLDWNKVLRA